MTNLDTAAKPVEDSPMDALFRAYIKFLEATRGKKDEVTFASTFVLPAVGAMLKLSAKGSVNERKQDEEETPPSVVSDSYQPPPLKDACDNWVELAEEDYPWIPREAYKRRKVTFAQCAGDLALCLFDRVLEAQPGCAKEKWRNVQSEIDPCTDAWMWQRNIYRHKNVKRKFEEGDFGKKGASMVYYLMRIFFECWEFNHKVAEDVKCQAIRKALCAKLEVLKQ